MHAPGRMTAYSVKIEEAEEGGYVVTVPSLPGCVTQGESYEEALAMAQEAIEGFLDALEKAGAPLPFENKPALPAIVQIPIFVRASA